MDCAPVSGSPLQEYYDEQDEREPRAEHQRESAGATESRRFLLPGSRRLDEAAGNPIPAIADRIGRLVVRFGVDNERAAVGIEQYVSPPEKLTLTQSVVASYPSVPTVSLA